MARADASGWMDAPVPYGSTATERATMARALAVLFFCGGSLVLLTLALPHDESTDELGVAIPPLLAYASCFVLLRLGGRVSVRALQLLLLAGAVLVSGCVVWGGESAAAYSFMYVWVALYAAYFFSRAAVAFQLVAAGLLYAVALALNGQQEVPHIHWVMAAGTVVVGAVMIARLTAAVRAQSADLSAVTQMASGLSDLEDHAQASCDGLRRSTGADVVIMLEPLEGEDGLQVTAMAGAPEAGLVFAGERAREGLEDAWRSAAPRELRADAEPPGWLRFDGDVVGYVQPVLRDGEAAALLALGWTSTRRAVRERARSAALLFAAETSVALDRVAAADQDRERQALEINDGIVQGLVVAKYLLQRGQADEATKALDETLAVARKLITDQLQSVQTGKGGLRPGDLARAHGAKVETVTLHER